jgi:hypothetical protein
MTAKKAPPIAWTVWKLVGVIGAIGLALGFFPAWWTFTNHWMNRAEVEETAKKVAEVAKAAQDAQTAALKDHKLHDNGIQTWNQYGFADVRAQFLADHKFECDTKKMMGQKMAASDAAICSRYESQLTLKLQEASDLKKQALDTTKEK